MELLVLGILAAMMGYEPRPRTKWEKFKDLCFAAFWLLIGLCFVGMAITGFVYTVIWAWGLFA